MEAKHSSRTRSVKRPTPMVMISNMAARHVCFTKRRRGLFKKVCELSTLCGTDSLAFVTSNAGKLYSIGTPNVPVAVERFLHMHSGGGDPAAAAGEQPPAALMTGDRRQLLEKLLEEIDALERMLDELRKLRALLRRSTGEKAGRLPRQWVEVLGELPTHELEEMMVTLKELLAKVGITTPEMAAEAARNHLISTSAPCGEELAQLDSGAGSHANAVLPVKYIVPLLPRGLDHDVVDRSRLAASVVSSSLFSAPRNPLGQAEGQHYWSSANPSTVLLRPYAPSWTPSSSMLQYYSTAVLIAPSTMPSVNQSVLLRRFPSILPPAAPGNTNASGKTDCAAALIATTSTSTTDSVINPAPSSAGLLIASPNLPAVRAHPPATTQRPLILNMSSFYSAMHQYYHPLLPSHDPSNISTSRTTAPHTNPGGRVAARATGHDVSAPTAVALVAQCVGNYSTAPGEMGPMSNGVRGEECGMDDSSPSSAPPSCGFFDIPRDFDFGRDWSV